MTDMTALVSAEISASLTDKMMRGVFVFSGNVEPDYYEQFEYAIPDYTGTPRTVFVGIFVDRETTYDEKKDQTTCIAYDFSWYLTMNYPSLVDRTLLSVIDQGNKFYGQLDFDNYTGVFQPGDIVTGATSGDRGLVYSVDAVNYRIVMEILTGVPTTGSDYFQDDEYLTVGGVNIAQADGQTVDYSLTEYYPEDWVERVLENVDGGGSTGIDPYRLANSATLWADPSTGIQKTFFFEDKETIVQCVDRIAEYMDYIFFRRWTVSGSVYTPAAYFIPESDIDSETDGLDLPAKVTITPTSYAVISPARYERSGGENFNRIIVRCQDLETSQWFMAIKETAEIGTGAIPRTYKETNGNISKQEEADNRADDLYDYYCTPILKYTVLLRARSDLQLIQLLAFSGFTGKITNADYRIVEILYRYADQGAVNHTQVVVIPDSQFRAYLQLKRTFSDTVAKMRAIIQDIRNGEMSVDIGTVRAINGNEVTMVTDQGVTKPSRDESA